MAVQITPEATGVWKLRTSLRKRAVKSNDNRLFIPSFDTGKVYTSQFIAVGVQVANSRDNWRNGGYLSQQYKFNSLGYQNSNKAFNRTQDLLVNNVSILPMPLLADGQYSLRYFPPTYFTEVQLQIWEYVGVQTDLLLRDLANFFQNAPADLLINLPAIEEKLDRIIANQQTGINVDLSVIEEKLDRLLANLPNENNKPALDINYYTFAKFFYLL